MLSAIVLSFLAAIAPYTRVARCESGMTNANTGNGFYGYWQFDRHTWEATTGLPGVASDYSFIVQLEGAVVLHRERGWAPWPVCGRLA